MHPNLRHHLKLYAQVSTFMEVYDANISVAMMLTLYCNRFLFRRYFSRIRREFTLNKENLFACNSE